MTSFSQLYTDVQRSPEYVAAGVQFEVAMATENLMNKQGISNTQLAEAVGCSKPYITKILRGDSNFTILSLAKIACALNSELKITIQYREPKDEVIKRAITAQAHTEIRKRITDAYDCGTLRDIRNTPWACKESVQLETGSTDNALHATAS